MKLAAAKGTTKELFSFQTTVPQRKLQCASPMGGVATCHIFDRIRCRGGDAFLAKVIAQEIAVHFHDLAFPVIRRLGVTITTGFVMVITHREAKDEKSSTTTFAEVIFDRMSLNAKSRRGFISSWIWSGEKNEGKRAVRGHGNSPHPQGSRLLLANREVACLTSSSLVCIVRASRCLEI